MGGWRRVALLVAVVGAGVAAAVAIRARWAALGPLRATPADSRLSVRVGETVDFSAEADGATGYTWSVWGRPVAHESTWRYVPAPEDAGWQQITVTVSGRGGGSAVRTWDVGVLTEVPPTLVDVTPPPGNVSLTPGTSQRFRCGARVVAARASDRLRFEWSVDGQTVAQEERPAAAAASQFELPVSTAGSHSVTVRVTEDDRVSSLAEWTVEVAAPSAPPAVAATPTAPAASPPAPPLRRLVRAPAPWRIDGKVGERIDFRSGLAPASGELSYDWKVNGRTAQAGRSPEFAYTPTHPGTHRVIVTLRADVGAVGVDAWRLEVGRPGKEPPTQMAATPPSTTAPPKVAATPPSTAEGPKIVAAPPSTIEPPPAVIVVVPPSTGEPAPQLAAVPSTTEPPPKAIAEKPPSTAEAPPEVALATPPSTMPTLAVAPPTADMPPKVIVGPPSTTVPPPKVVAAAPPSTTVPPPKVIASATPPSTVPPAKPAPREAQPPSRAREQPAPEPSGREKEKTRVIAAVEPERRAVPTRPEPPPDRQAALRPSPTEPPPAAAPLSDGLGEEEVRRWLDEYAHAWSRRDVGALRRMGQIRSDGEEQRLVRYFGNVQELHVDVRLRSLRVEGDRAAVEFERIDTVTDPAGHRQELRLPIQHKEIRRIPGGLRFAE